MPKPLTDAESMLRLAAGSQEALQPLFQRHAPLVHHLASQSLGADAAEDIVQDVFLTVWRKAASFDPGRGSFRSWLLQITHFRILNELRRRSRRPAIDPEAGAKAIEEWEDDGGGPAEEAWQEFRREAVRAAVGRLPPAQRRALSLAFFEQLTHDQVAMVLNLPLGTVKTRIRSGMQKLRFLLAPLGVVVLAVAVLAGLAIRSQQQVEVAARRQRALSFVTASDISLLHLSPAQGVPAQTHGSYRGRASTPLAVIALHSFPAAPQGKAYQVWLLRRGSWASAGTVKPDAQGNILLIAEGPGFAELPEAIEVTLEPAAGSPAPSGPAMVRWPNK